MIAIITNGNSIIFPVLFKNRTASIEQTHIELIVCLKALTAVSSLLFLASPHCLTVFQCVGLM